MNIRVLENKKRFVVFVILSIVFLAFSSTLSNQFVGLDDPNHLLENPYVVSLNQENIIGMFRSTINKIYVPLTTLSFACEYHFFQFEPCVYHLNNLLLHMAVTGMVFYFGIRLGLSVFAAGIGALIFGVHPMRVESVAWVTERKDVLYAFFYLLALHQYWSYLEGKKKWVSYVFSIIFGVLSILAKPMAVSLPFIFCILDWFHRRPWRWAAVMDKFIHFGYIVPIAWLTAALHDRPPSNDWGEALLTAVWSLIFYIQKFIYPVDLSPIYELPQPISLVNPEFLFAGGLFGIYLLCVIYYRGYRWFIFANLYFLASIFFLIRFQSTQDVNVVGDRFMYLPSLGFCFLTGIFMENILVCLEGRRKFQRGVVLGVSGIVFMFSIKTYQQSNIWKDDETLWNSTLKIVPHSGYAYFARGKMYDKKGDYKNAIDDYTKVIELAPKKGIKAYNNRGVLFEKFGQRDLALADYSQAIEIDSEFASVYNNRGALYYQSQKDDLALADLNHAIALDPEFAMAYANRGLLYFALYKDDLALKDFNQSIELDPTVMRSYMSRAELFSHTHRHQLAIKDLTTVIELNPFEVKAYQERAKSYTVMGEHQKALTDMKRVHSLSLR